MGFFSDLAKPKLSGPLATIAEKTSCPLEPLNETVFFLGAITLMASVAKADGTIGIDELNTFDNFLKDEVQCSNAVRHRAVHAFNEARDHADASQGVAKEIYRHLRRRVDMRIELLELLFRVACVDSNFDEREKRVLTKIASGLKVPPETVKHVETMYTTQDGRVAALARLRCNEGASTEEVELSFKELLADSDPESLMNDGFPQEFLNLIRRRQAELERAYLALLPSRARHK